jgi:hypothetical protein
MHVHVYPVGVDLDPERHRWVAARRECGAIGVVDPA